MVFSFQLIQESTLWDGNKGRIQRLPAMGAGMDNTQCEYPPLHSAVRPSWCSPDVFNTEWHIRQFDYSGAGLCAIGSRKGDLLDYIILFDQDYNLAASFPAPVEGSLKVSHGYVADDQYVLFLDRPGQQVCTTVRIDSGILRPDESTISRQDYLTELKTVEYKGCCFPVAVTQPANSDVNSPPRCVFLSAYGCFGHQTFNDHAPGPVESEVLQKGGMVARVWLPPVRVKVSDTERRPGRGTDKAAEKLIKNFVAVMQGLQTEYKAPVIVGGYGMSSILAAASINRLGCAGSILLTPLLEREPLAKMMDRFPFLSMDVAKQLQVLAKPYAWQYPPTLVWRAQGKPLWTAEVERSDLSANPHLCFYLQAGFSGYLHQGYYSLARSIVGTFIDRLPAPSCEGAYLPGVVVHSGERNRQEKSVIESDSEAEDSYEPPPVHSSPQAYDQPEKETVKSVDADQHRPEVKPAAPLPKTVSIKMPTEFLQEFYSLLKPAQKEELAALNQLQGMNNGLETRTETGLTLMHIAARWG